MTGHGLMTGMWTTPFTMRENLLEPLMGDMLWK